jgi:cysteine-rich repeat protein
MARFLETKAQLVLVPAMALAGVAACGDDDVIDPTTTTATTGGGATTSTTVGGGGTGGIAQGGGGAGGGGAPPTECMGPDTGTDTCDGQDLVLTNGTELLLCGDLTSSTDDYQDPFCAAASASGDNVYNVVVNDIGTLKVQVRREVGSLLNPTMFARAGGACTDQSPGATFGCWDFFNTHEEFATEYDPAFFGPSFHLFIAGGLDATNMSTTGGYELEISLTAPACGDGVQNFSTNEECDDGNTLSGDGCSSACIIETTSLFDECPGEPVNLVGSPASIVLTANTIGNADDYTPVAGGSCGNIPVGGNDRVYRVTPNTSGTLTATVGLASNCIDNICETLGGFDPGCWDYVLWATGPSAGSPYPECGDTSFQLGCSDTKALGPEAISFPVVGGQSYFIIVDGYPGFENTAGPFNLCLELN